MKRFEKARRALTALTLTGSLLSASWGLSAAGISSGLPEAHAAIVERIVAVVGKRAILFSELKTRARPQLLQVFAGTPEGPQRSATISQLYQATLGQMIEEELESKAAAKAGIAVTSDEVDQALEMVAGQNGITKGQMLAEAKRSGISVPEYRGAIRRQILQSRLQELRFQGRIRITEDDLRVAYGELLRQERYQLPQRTARLYLPIGQTEAQKRNQHKLALKLARRARTNENFIDLVAEYGAPGSGLAQEAPPFQEPPMISRATMNLQPGQISAPFPLGGFLVIVTVIDRAPSQIPDFDLVRDRLQQQVYSQKLQTARQHWLDGLKKRTHVDIRL